MARSKGAHEAFVEHRQPKSSSDRMFGLTVGLFLLAVAGVRSWLEQGSYALRAAFAGIGVLLVVLGIAAPHLLAPLNRAWTKLSLLLAAVVNPIIMLFMFVLVFLPIAIVMRIGGRDMLRLKRDANAQSYWVVRDPPGPKPGGMINQF